MQSESLAAVAAPEAAMRRRYAGPIWTLIVLAPVIGEVLSGSTRLSFLFALVPEMMVWGCGALLCRELARRWQGGGPSLLCMGLALSVAEEFIIQQTSLAPLPFPGANAGYGRFWGVNWLYFLFMLGYESVWVVLVPVEVTELLFPARRSQPWLRKGGLIANCLVFVVGAYIAWFAWTQQALPKKMHVPPYHPPVSTIAAGVAAILLLMAVAYALRGVGLSNQNVSTHAVSKPAVNPWRPGLAALVMGSAWFQLISLVFNRTLLPVWIPLAAGCAGALLTYLLILHWSTRRAWEDRQRWSIAFGATLACVWVEYLSTVGWTRSDLVFKTTLDVLAVAGFLALGRKVWQRTAANWTESAGNIEP